MAEVKLRGKITMEMIDACFEGKDHQVNVAVDLYKIIFPDWEKIEKVEGWPTVDKETVQRHIFRKFQEFDRKHHPEVMQGGLWLNNGFSTLEAERLGVGEWEYDRSEVALIYKIEPA